jgi:hypothetical protein
MSKVASRIGSFVAHDGPTVPPFPPAIKRPQTGANVIADRASHAADEQDETDGRTRMPLPSALTRSRCQPLYSGFPGAPFRTPRGARRPRPHGQHRPQRRRRCTGDPFRGRPPRGHAHRCRVGTEGRRVAVERTPFVLLALTASVRVPDIRTNAANPAGRRRRAAPARSRSPGQRSTRCAPGHLRRRAVSRHSAVA